MALQVEFHLGHDCGRERGGEGVGFNLPVFIARYASQQNAAILTVLEVTGVRCCPTTT